MTTRRWRLAAALLLAWGLAASAQQPAPLRAVWLHIRPDERTPQAADAVLGRCQAAHLNAVFLLVYYHGVAAYKSDLVPQEDFVQAGYDALAEYVRAGHQRGMQVHAWFVNADVEYAPADTVLKRHPDWALRDSRGTPTDWLCFARPEVRQYNADVMLEVAKKYQVDGIHFDYIRQPSPDYCYCDYCRKELKTQSVDLDLFGGETLPAVLNVNANPVAEPTTPQVLATFGETVSVRGEKYAPPPADQMPPAITLNTCGQGHVLLYNWSAHQNRARVLGETLKNFLSRYAPQGPIRFLKSPANEVQYGTTSLETVRDHFAKLGLKGATLAAGQLAQAQPAGVVIVPAIYRWGPGDPEALRDFVKGGASAVVIDGPVFAMDNAAIQELLGMKRSGRYFTAEMLLRAAPNQDLVPHSDQEPDVARLREQRARWTEWRCNNVTEAVRLVRERQRKEVPKVQATAAVFSRVDSAREGVLQDWPRWVKEDLIDYALPMAYFEKTPDLKDALDEYDRVVGDWSRLVVGLSLYQNQKGAVPRDPALVVEQTNLSLARHPRGTCFFELHYLDDPIRDALLQGPFAR